MQKYVMYSNWAMPLEDGNILHNVGIVGEADALEEIQKMLADKATKEKEFANAKQWEIFVDSEVEFNAGVRDNYALNHTHLFIKRIL